jgi:hypothetical protein
MKEYSEDHLGFYHTEFHLKEGVKWRPVDIQDGIVVFDSETEEARRAANRERVAKLNKPFTKSFPASQLPTLEVPSRRKR